MKKDQGSVGRRSQMVFRRNLRSATDTTPALRATPSAEGEYPRATFYERNTKALDVNSPFLEGVDFLR